jgi:predicted DsbA family dithiol-disulfide isomerase
MTVDITYFSDVLCIWAYVAQARLEAIPRTFGRDVAIRPRFCSVFGDARGKIAAGWRDRGGFAGYSRHVQEIATRFPHIEVHPDTWLKTRPASSASPHLFITALRQIEAERPENPASTGDSGAEAVAHAFRRAFFAEARDIADWDVQCAIAESFGVDIGAVERKFRDGTAFAGLAADYQDAERMRIEGSPTFVLNEGRQKLFGNVGFRIIEANIREMLQAPAETQASWC